MGNQLVGAAPAQILPVENYLADIASDLDFDISLGSTRFLKVARARHHSGLVVVKVFTIQDPGLNLKKDRDKLLDIKKVLEGSVNCLPFHQAFVIGRVGFIVNFVKKMDENIQANAEGFYVVSFFNEQEKSLTEPTVTYIFSKFGQVSEIKYVEHGRVFIFYKEKEEALKALEIMNMGSKYHVKIEWQPVKKNETTENIKKEGEVGVDRIPK